MSDYQRIVSYLYEYRRGIKGPNVGFAKIERRQNRLKLFFRMKTSEASKAYRLYLYQFHHGVMDGTLLDTITSQPPIFTYKNVLPLTLSPEEADGFLIYSSHNDFYGSQWNNHPLKIRSFNPDTKQDVSPKEASTSPAKSTMIKPQQNTQASPKLVKYIEALQMEQETKTTDKAPWWEEYASLAIPCAPHLNPCIKGTILSLEKHLPSGPFSNGFLTESEKLYGHILYGKDTSTEKSILGAPAIFDNETAFIAKSFGFLTFVPLKEQAQKTNSFGYFLLSF